MILITHMLAGAIIGSKIPSYPGIILLALISHYILDKIPHWDYFPENISKLNAKGWIFFAFEVFADLLAGLILIWLILGLNQDPIRILTGTFFGILTDGLMILNIVTREKNKFLKWAQNIHSKVHFQNYKKTPLSQRLFWEIFIAGLLIALAFII